jgi:hypothetical protein
MRCVCVPTKLDPLISTIFEGEILVNGFVHTDLGDELPSGKRLARSTKNNKNTFDAVVLSIRLYVSNLNKN